MDKIVENLKRCPSYNTCNRNLCPLDLELELRYGGKGDMCKWMQEPKPAKIGNRKFISGGSVMPDELLKFVPKENVKWLNEVLQKNWHKVYSKAS